MNYNMQGATRSKDGVDFSLDIEETGSLSPPTDFRGIHSSGYMHEVILRIQVLSDELVDWTNFHEWLSQSPLGSRVAETLDEDAQQDGAPSSLGKFKRIRRIRFNIDRTFHPELSLEKLFSMTEEIIESHLMRKNYFSASDVMQFLNAVMKDYRERINRTLGLGRRKSSEERIVGRPILLNYNPLNVTAYRGIGTKGVEFEISPQPMTPSQDRFSYLQVAVRTSGLAPFIAKILPSDTGRFYEVIDAATRHLEKCVAGEGSLSGSSNLQ